MLTVSCEPYDRNNAREASANLPRLVRLSIYVTKKEYASCYLILPYLVSRIFGFLIKILNREEYFYKLSVLETSCPMRCYRGYGTRTH
jgi:hypothetical protein